MMWIDSKFADETLFPMEGMLTLIPFVFVSFGNGFHLRRVSKAVRGGGADHSEANVSRLRAHLPLTPHYNQINGVYISTDKKRYLHKSLFLTLLLGAKRI
jgi:hypothetical protein